MKRYKNISVGLTAFMFVFASITPSYSAASLLNKSCTKLKATKVSAGKNLICTSKAGKKIWTLQKIALPTSVPSFSLKYQNSEVTAVLIANSFEINAQKITGAEAVVYAKVNGNYNRIASAVWNVNTANLNVGSNTVNFNMPSVSSAYKGYELAVEIRYLNAQGVGEKALKSIPVPAAEPTPTATPTPTTTPTQTPTPVALPTPTPLTSAAPIAEVGCSVNYLSPLPYASQRMSITNMAWEKDSLGYVSVNMSIRNDNSMALRLVEFTFYLMHKGTLIITTSTIEGNHHFYIQDDAKFNSTDGLRGAWMPGQTRVFKIPTNQMLECKSISVLSSGYTVKQGIGAN
jgi:hypothetical protein